MNKEKFKQLLDSYLAGKLSDEESKLFQAWYNSFGELENGIPDLESMIKTDALESELRARVFKQTPLLQRKTTVRQLFNWKIMAAATALIVLGSILTLYKSEYNPIDKKNNAFGQNRIIQTGVGQIRKIGLKDGSTLHLNANSKVLIPAAYASTNRTIQLEEGEAYFEIVKDRLHPFIVKTRSLQIRVLGTAFNVSAYNQAKSVDVQVNHGKVEVSDINKSVLGSLTKNQAISYNKQNGKGQIMMTDGFFANSWITGSVLLTKASFSDLALQLKNIYGVKLISKKSNINKFSFNLTIKRERSLEATLDVICGIHQSKYRRKGNEIEVY
jgi:transmembrane sensor